MITRDQLIDATLAACEEMFQLMLPLRLSPEMGRRPLPEPAAEQISGEVVVSLGLTGQCSGNISLYLSEAMALMIASLLLQQSYDCLGPDVFESVGEVLNLIAGGLKNRLSSDEEDIFDMSIPLVISGRDKYIFHGSGKEWIPIPVDTDQGLFYITLVLDRQS